MVQSFSPPGPAVHQESEQPILVAIEGGQSQPAHSARLSELVHEHLDFVWRSLRRFGVREADVDDATQRVFLVANEKLERIEDGREKAFLIGTAARVAAHVRRAYKRRDAAEGRFSAAPPPSVPDPEELTQRREDRDLLDRVLDRMPEELRAVFVLFELEELSVDEIARLLTLPRGTAATRLRRSREVFHESAKAVASELGGGHQ
jgi:RNA polymerase sigma-70 factor (ECF subfamily)